MRQNLFWICVVWLFVETSEVPYLSRWLGDVDHAWNRLLQQVSPGFGIRLWTLALVVGLSMVGSEAFSRRSPANIVGLRLRRQSLRENGRVLSLESKSPRNMTVASLDYLENICFIERRFNGWFLIGVVVVPILATAAYLVSEERSRVVGGIVFGVAIVALLLLLRGRVTVGTADGSAMSVVTDKVTAEAICQAVTDSDKSGFHLAVMSSPVSERTMHLRKSLVTGMTTVSRFPFLAALFFVATLFAAFRVYDKEPRAMIAPAVMFIIVLFLMRRRPMLKMMGGHYRFLGSSDTPEGLMSVISPQKTQVAGTEVVPANKPMQPTGAPNGAGG